jgi:hypothetical protein
MMEAATTELRFPHAYRVTNAVMNDVVVGDLVLVDPVWGLEVVSEVHRHEFSWPGSSQPGELLRFGLSYIAYGDENEVKSKNRFVARFPHEPVLRVPKDRGL